MKELTIKEKIKQIPDIYLFWKTDVEYVYSNKVWKKRGVYLIIRYKSIFTKNLFSTIVREDRLEEYIKNPYKFKKKYFYKDFSESLRYFFKWPGL